MEISSFSHVQAARRRLITRPLTVEEEIEALKYARNAVIAGRPYICALIGEYVGCGYPLVRELAIIDEINEFLDDSVTVENWLGVFPALHGRQDLSHCNHRHAAGSAWRRYQGAVKWNSAFSRKPSLRGSFNLRVNNYNSRGKAVDGFDVEIEILGETYSFNYPKKLRQSETVDVATITKRGDTFTVSSSLAEASSSKDVWSLKTQNFVEVGSIMLSPNHWDGHDIGNRHWFFMLNGCRNEGTARGLYNEFLRSDLDKHRKVMEMVGSKMHTENSDQQLSGLGFSSTKRDSLVCRITGSFSRVVRVLF